VREGLDVDHAHVEAPRLSLAENPRGLCSTHARGRVHTRPSWRVDPPRAPPTPSLMQLKLVWSPRGDVLGRAVGWCT
jgi:hypothetical protein